MAKRRSRIIAAQAVVVGALMVVVFLTLLRPEGSGPLFGVTGPAEPERVVQKPPDQPPDHQRGEHGSNGGGGTDRPETQPGEIQGGAPGGVVFPGPTEGSAPEGGVALDDTSGGESGGGSPADDQYGDTLTRLMSRLN